MENLDLKEISDKKLLQKANDCLDRADGAGVDTNNFERQTDRAILIRKILLEDKRVEAEREIELKKIEVEKEIELKKIEQSGKITSKDVFLVGAPAALGAVGYLWKSKDWDKKATYMWEKELSNTLTSTAGKSLWREYLSLFNFIGRKH